MSNQEILTKAIAKAFDSGWEPSGRLAMWVYKTGFVEEEQYGYIYEVVGLNDLIFNHDFAKALWGERIYQFVSYDSLSKLQNAKLPLWKVHLQQMVIAEDPLEYLKENM